MKPLLFAIACLLVLTSCKRTPVGNNAAVGRYYNIRGFKMYCEVYGKGQPLLFIHGNNGNMSSFARNVPFFAKHYRVILADSRAQGKSVDDRDSLSFEMMADDFNALLDTMHVRSAYVIGWSDGGINALELAMRHPDKVAKLVATGANLWPDSTAINPKDWLDDYKDVPKYQHNQGKTAAERLDRKMFFLDWNQPHIALADLHKIQCPALIMCGDHDVIRTEHTRLIAKNIPKANLWIVKDSGHGTLFEHRRKADANVNYFLSTPFNPNRKFDKRGSIFDFGY